MGNTRDIFKKISETKGKFHAKMDTINDRNGMNITEAEDIKKRWQEYTNLYKKDLHNQVTDFIFLGSKITADGDCSHEIKRRLPLRRKVMTNLDSIFKSRDITLSTKVHLVKAMVFSSGHVWMRELDYKES